MYLSSRECNLVVTGDRSSVKSPLHNGGAIVKWPRPSILPTKISLRTCSQQSPIFTARERSLGQGNVFTIVCHSVQGGGLHPEVGLGRHPQWILQDTVDERAVSILLECILVLPLKLAELVLFTYIYLWTTSHHLRSIRSYRKSKNRRFS